jgi:uncharacterized integral membrane protein
VRRLLWLFVAVPVAVLLIVFSVANRAPVTMLLDPFSRENPAIALTLPFFVFIFAAFVTGLLIGGFLVWLSQGRNRKEARRQAAEAKTWRAEAEQQRNRADALVQARQGSAPATFPVPANRDRAA